MSGGTAVIGIPRFGLKYLFILHYEWYSFKKPVDAIEYIPTSPCVAKRELPILWTVQSVAEIIALIQTVFTDDAACKVTHTLSFLNGAECGSNKFIENLLLQFFR